MDQNTDQDRYDLLVLKVAIEREVTIDELKERHLIAGTPAEQLAQVMSKLDELEHPKVGEDPVEAPVEEPIADPVEEPAPEDPQPVPSEEQPQEGDPAPSPQD